MNEVRGSNSILWVSGGIEKASSDFNSTNTRDGRDTDRGMANKGKGNTTRDRANRGTRFFSPPPTDGFPWGKALDRYIQSRLWEVLSSR